MSDKFHMHLSDDLIKETTEKIDTLREHMSAQLLFCNLFLTNLRQYSHDNIKSGIKLLRNFNLASHKNSMKCKCEQHVCFVETIVLL